MSRRRVAGSLAIALALGIAVRPARGQAPTTPSQATQFAPGSTQSRMGRPPGAGVVPFGDSPGAGADVLGGRPGAGTPRVPTTITTPGGGYTVHPVGGIAPPPALPLGNVPLYGPLELPTGPAEEGPAHGLTLDMAIERMVRENIYLRSVFFEIPQAQADILTASLRANPFLYWDTQLVPYGQYSNRRPGGPLQYDLNLTQPIDLSHKRYSRVLVAAHAKRVLEAQYQDAVRIQIDNLYRAFLDVLSARETVRLRQTSIAGLRKLVEVTKTQRQESSATSADLARGEMWRNTAELMLESDEEMLRRSTRVLAGLLYFPPADADRLEIRGTIHDKAPPPPTGDDLIQIAIDERPDLRAYRLGIDRARADVRLARANRFQDVYLLYQPFTFQNNEPFGLKSSTSWAIGMTIPLPIFNQNQGNIQRSLLNVDQSQIELTGAIRQVITEVQNAEREYLVSRRAVEQFEEKVLVHARKYLEVSHTLFVEGESDVTQYLNAELQYNDSVRSYIEMLIRHRRSMLLLNTAVGQRLLP
jgi:outer membrane protein, heavy metal efflux system